MQNEIPNEILNKVFIIGFVTKTRFGWCRGVGIVGGSLRLFARLLARLFVRDRLGFRYRCIQEASRISFWISSGSFQDFVMDFVGFRQETSSISSCRVGVRVAFHLLGEVQRCFGTGSAA